MADFLSTFLEQFWFLLLEMSPFLLFGFLFSGILSVMLSVETVAKYLGNNRPFSVFFASLFGIPLPLCSCGVIPVFSYLKKHGASKGAATSFLISTPQTGIDSIAVTYSMLGPLFAVVRPIVAFVSGIIGGTLVSVVDNEKKLANATDCHDECCDDDTHSTIYRIFNYGFVKLVQDIGPTLLVGLFLASLISMLIEPEYFLWVSSGLIGMIVMLLLGIPSYICATASVPIAFMLHVKGGFSMGTLLVFLMSGPATNMATISIAFKQLGKKSALLYLGSIILCSIVAGLLFDFFFPGYTFTASAGDMTMLPYEVQLASAIFLLLILANIYRIKYFVPKIQVAEPLSKNLYIDGMTCNHCVESVKNTLNKLQGVSIISVNLDSGKLEFNSDNHHIELIKKEIVELGFKIKSD